MIKAVFPGTYDPIHYGHMDIARRAARLFDLLVVAVYDRPLKNLVFSPEERISLVSRAFANEPKIQVTGYSGLTVDFCKKIIFRLLLGDCVFSPILSRNFAWRWQTTVYPLKLKSSP